MQPAHPRAVRLSQSSVQLAIEWRVMPDDVDVGAKIAEQLILEPFMWEPRKLQAMQIFYELLLSTLLRPS